jgi:hypothetical protein
MKNMLEWLIKKHCEAEKLGWPPGKGAPTPSTTQAASTRRRD